MKRIGAILFWLGLVIAIAGVVATAVFGARTVGTLSESVSDAGTMTNGSSTVTMGEGELRTIYGASSADTESATCDVTGPDGQAVAVKSATDFGDFEGAPVREVGSFESTSAGEYQVECTGGATLIGPAVDLGQLTSGAVGLVVGVLAIGLGGLLLLVGAVLWFIGRSKAKKAAQAGPYGPGGYNQGGQSQGGYSQGSYNQGGYPSTPPPPGSNQQPPSTNPYQTGSGSTPPPPPPAGY